MSRIVYFNGKRMRAARKALGWTMRDLAASSGVNCGYICDLENGNQTNPTIESFTRLQKLLGPEASDLLSWKAPKRGRPKSKAAF